MRVCYMLLYAALLGCAAAGDDLIVNVDPDAVTGKEGEAAAEETVDETGDEGPVVFAEPEVYAAPGIIVRNIKWRTTTFEFRILSATEDAYEVSVAYQMEVANNNSWPVECTWRFTFIDADGFEIGTATPFSTDSTPPRYGASTLTAHNTETSFLAPTRQIGRSAAKLNITPTCTAAADE